MNINIGMNVANRMAAGNQVPMVNQVQNGNKNKAQSAGKMLAGNKASGGYQTLFGTQKQNNAFQMKRMLRNGGAQANKQNAWGQQSSVVDNMLGYSDTIRASREKAKNAALEVKKLQYSYTSVSSKILRSKTSASAKQAAGQARREILRLQQKRNNSDYDQEELEAAITHAKAMERLAKKKARHLEEEELVKVSGGACAGEVEEKDELREEEAAQEEEWDAAEEEPSDTDELTEEEMEELAAEVMSDAEIDTMSLEEMEAFVSEMQQSMEEVLEESGLNDLLEEMTASSGEEMDPADYKMMKIKHRCKEMKDLAKADADYLKVIFRKMEESKGKAIDSMKGMGSGGSAGIFGGAAMSGGGAPVAVHIDIPVSDASAGAAAGGDAPSVDVSV